MKEMVFNKQLLKKGFTIIELLIVIGILSILAITLLVVLNPAEAQKRSRDAKRLKDANTLQTIIQQYLDDSNSFGSTCSTTTPCSSSASGSVDATVCSGTGNWLGGTSADLCNYAKTIPTDPSNGTTRTCVTGTGTTGNCIMEYKVAISGSNYEINVRQESTSNETKVTGDSGDSTRWVEVYTGVNTLMTD